MTNFTESALEEALLEYLASIGSRVHFDPKITPSESLLLSLLTI